MAAWARDIEDDQKTNPALAIDAIVFDPDGRARVTVALHGPRDDPEDLGRRAAKALLEQGASPLLGRNPVV